ncbi:S-adenosylmethionine-diacylglycerol 3-amino-3-carboxypropyl transferase [Labrys wisconsinensis]|uniref:S-adenosylmethionine-diacylglycerol 3-amino-3-carboxypropyl transferase n=1 Tax=Labrys wisconsinensis TaxID=425677 RepID=A0ABU0JJK7_9HYPH|nr:S-adenosylmethionine-diacylglycerol 3-amino-3-carboxypropyl transferase [Labrys wisconsinensis]
MSTVETARTREDAAASSRRRIKGAVEHHRLLSLRGLQDRLFTLAFSGLVYAQIWEDPEIDMEALALKSTDRLVAIASGGCNVMSYLLADPAAITAVDLNAHHVALNRLKVAAARHLPDHAAFYDLFARAGIAANLETYARLRPALDAETRAYWDGRDALGRRRARYFTKNLYQHGLLGRFIGFGHLVGRLHRIDPSILLSARDREEQRAIFERRIAPLFDRAHIRWFARRRASLYGLGIPPAQYDSLASGGDMATVLRGRLERLACDFDLADNYFAWQAFGRGYKPEGDGPVPPYLGRQAFETVQARADRIEVRHVNLIDHLRSCPAGSLDAYVLLDAQDWMTDEILTTLWQEITRTARSGARVIFRTSAEESLLPGRVPDIILDRWAYDRERCRDFTARDRSAIYGGFHLYTLRPLQ